MGIPRQQGDSSFASVSRFTKKSFEYKNKPHDYLLPMDSTQHSAVCDMYGTSSQITTVASIAQTLFHR